jgi:nicotinamide mononucleotide transporter
MSEALTLEVVIASFVAIPAAEWVAVAFALAYLLLAVRQNPWCWAAAAVSSVSYLVLFARGGLVMQALLQVFYLAMAAYGWYAWRGGAVGQGATLPVTRWSAARNGLAIATVVGAALLNGRMIAGETGSVVAYVDALVAWASVLATWLVTRKVLENWLYWIVADAIAVVLYWTQGFHATAVLFVIYVVIAVRGYFAWRRDLEQGVAVGVARA